MNILFRLFVFLGAVFVVALFAALIAPYFINWDEFTDEFERQASQVIGQPVKVGGDTTIRLLPLPSLGFNDLEVGETDDGRPMMTVDVFSLKAELFPFLSGEMRIVEMDMQRPRVNVELDEKGAIGWTQPGDLILNPEQVNIEKLSVSDGTMFVSGLTGGRQLTLDKIDAAIDAKSLIGPWSVLATANIDGEPTDLKIQTGTFQDTGSIRLKVEASQLKRPYRLLLDGPVQLKDDILEWAGSFELTPFSKQRVEEMAVKSEPLPVQSEGVFTAKPEGIEISQYRMEVGPREDPYVITGKGNIAIAKEITFDVDAEGRQIDLDRIKRAENAAGVNTLETRISAMRSILERVPVPPVNGIIKMKLPALVAGDTYIRDVSANIRPFGQGWDLQEFVATFPGNTILEAKGRLGLRNDFGFDGHIVLASRQPSGFASWISGDVDPIFRKLKNFGIEADMSLSERQTKLENMELRLDDAKLRGKMQRIPSRENQPAIILELKGNRVNVENLRAIYSLFQRPEEKNQLSHDLDIEVTAEVLEAVIGGEEVLARGVDSHVKVRDGSVSVERFNAEAFYGAQIESSGRIDNLLSNPNGNMQFSVTAEDAAPLLVFSKKYIAENQFIDNLLLDPTLTKDTALSVEIDTTAQVDGAKGQVLAEGSVGGTELDMKFGFDGRFDDGANLPISIVGSLKNIAPSVLMQQMGIDTLPTETLGEAPGPMSVTVDFQGQSADGLVSQISVQLPNTSFVANGSVQTNDWNRFDSDLAVTLGSGNLAPYAVITGVKLLGLKFDQTLPVSLSFDFKQSDSETKFENLSGQISGNGFNGALLLQEKGVARPRLSGNMQLDELDLELVSASVFGNQSSLATDVSQQLGLEKVALSFGNPFYEGLDADLKITAQKIQYGDVLSGTNASLKLVMLDGGLDAEDLAFETLGGKFSGGARLKNTQGTVLANLRYFFSDLDLERVGQKINLPEFLSGKVSVQGSSEASAKSLEALIANLSGNGLINFSNVVADGFNPAGFDDVLLETGADGYEITEEAVQDLVRDTILISSIDIAELEAPFSINRGRLRVRNIGHSLVDSKLTGDMEVNLASAMLDADLNIVFDPGRREAIQGTDPQLLIYWKGPIAKPELALDTGRLEGYLSVRAFEQSQRRVETLEAKVLEKQRLQQQIALSFAKENYIVRRREEIIQEQGEIEGLRLENASRLFLDEISRREEDIRIKEEEERRRREEEEARIRAEEEARLEAERKAGEEAERLEAERLAKLEAERLAAEKKVREEAERKEAARLAKLEAERLEAERLAKLEAERLVAEKKAREEAERKEAARLAKLEAERHEAERLAKLEAERLAAEKKAREEAERKEAARLAKLEAERHEAERLAKLEAERLAAEKKAREEADRKEAERLAKLEAERLEAERLAKLEAERLAAEKKARAEAERKEAERLETERQAALKAEREEAIRLAAQKEQEALEQAEREREEEAAREQAARDEIPVEVQNLLRENIMKNLESFLSNN